MNVKSGWFDRQSKSVDAEIEQWPEWMRKEASFSKRKKQMSDDLPEVFKRQQEILSHSWNDGTDPNADYVITAWDAEEMIKLYKEVREDAKKFLDSMEQYHISLFGCKPTDKFFKEQREKYR